MSTFDYGLMSNEDISVVCFNKEKWTKEQALEQAKSELPFSYDSTKEKLKVFSSVVQYGFFRDPSGELTNSWFCPSIYKSLSKQSKTQVEVWVVGLVEELEEF